MKELHGLSSCVEGTQIGSFHTLKKRNFLRPLYTKEIQSITPSFTSFCDFYLWIWHENTSQRVVMSECLFTLIELIIQTV